jgi:hypothetical protein
VDAYLAGNPTLPEVLGHQPILQIAESCSLLEVVLWQEHVPQTQLLSLNLQVFDDLGVGGETFGGRLADLT